MPIERDGKHWCDPASETPDGNGLWTCACGIIWSYEPDARLWSPAPEATKKRTRAAKGGAE